MKFKDYSKSIEIKKYLLNILSRTGGVSKNSTFLYHYSSIYSISNIIKNKYLWLGHTEKMNDYLEGEFIESVEENNNLFFSSFSKVEENIAMYKMYAPNPDGAMIVLPYSAADKIIKTLVEKDGTTKKALIVRNREATNENINAKLYWAEVCYKNLHDDLITVGTVFNNNITNPLNEPDLAGFIKLHGWKYEEEVRLCAMTERALMKDERIALRLYDGFEKDITIITGPGFDKDKHKKIISNLKRQGIKVQNSEYEGLIDIGIDITEQLGKRIEELETENAGLKRLLEEKKSDEENDKAVEKHQKTAEKHQQTEEKGDLILDNIKKDSPSLESCFLLIYAAASDGKIIKGSSFGLRKIISVRDKGSFDNGTTRDIAIWQEALDDLVNLKWARSEKIGVDFEIYEITATGYKKADEINTILKIDTKKDPRKEYELKKKKY